MTDANQDPTREPQLAETWGALAHLLAASAEPVDEDALVAGIVRRAERRARRRSLRYRTVSLAAAASLLAAVGAYSWLDRKAQGPEVAVVPPSERTPVPAPPVAAQRAPRFVDIETAQRSGEEFVPTAWEDELAADTASLADELDSVEQRWQEQPDSVALLQTQLDSFEQEIRDSSL